MSEGIFLLPRNLDDGLMKQLSQTTAFGTAGVVVSAKPGRIYRVSFVNKAAATKYFAQVFNKATAPINGDLPAFEGQVAANSDVVFDLASAGGWYVRLGIGIAISTTAGVLTLAGATDATAYVLYTSAG
jgi:hypothetical protein